MGKFISLLTSFTCEQISCYHITINSSLNLLLSFDFRLLTGQKKEVMLQLACICKIQLGSLPVSFLLLECKVYLFYSNVLTFSFSLDLFISVSDVWYPNIH